MSFLKVLSAVFNQCLEGIAVTDMDGAWTFVLWWSRECSCPQFCQMNSGDTGGHMGRGNEQVPGFPDRLGSQWLIVLQFIEMFLVFYPLLF